MDTLLAIYKITDPGGEKENIFLAGFIQESIIISERMQHEADAILRIEGNKLEVTKNRYHLPDSEMHVDNSKIINTYQNLIIRLYSSLWPNAIDKQAETKQLILKPSG